MATLPRIQNMTATADLSYMQDLVAIKVLSDEKNFSPDTIDYNPSRFRAAIFRIKNPKGTVLVFDSGKVVCVGCKEIDVAKQVFKKCEKIIKKLGFKVKLKNFAVHNFVASWNMGIGLNLKDFTIAHRNYCSYEQELFPGCVYEMQNSHIKLLIFLSGKVIVTGLKKVTDMDLVYKEIVPKLKPFEKKV